MSFATAMPIVTETCRDDASCVLALRGELSLHSTGLVVRELSKALLDVGQVLVDLSRLRVSWLPALQVFPSTLASVGGWPEARLVLFGAADELRERMQELRIPDAVPLVPDERAARARLGIRPARIVRYHNLFCEPLAQRHCRRFVHAACADWGVGDVTYDAALVATELVTNVVQHARTACRLILTLDSRGLTVGVRDGRPGTIPRLRPVNLHGRGGRGLLMIAGLARSWGITEHEYGKTIWAVLPDASPP
jgi:hypothetical protein